MNHAKSYPQLTAVTPLDSEHTRLTFADGSERILDERHITWRGTKPAGRPVLANYGLTWPDELVHLDGTPVAFDVGADEAFELSTPLASNQ